MLSPLRHTAAPHLSPNPLPPFPPPHPRPAAHPAPPPAPSEEVSKARLNAMRGVEHHDRIDAELYHDFESEEARKVGAPRPGRRRPRTPDPGEGKSRRAASVRRRAAPTGWLTWRRPASAPQRRLAKEAREKERLEKLASKVGASGAGGGGAVGAARRRLGRRGAL
jgi:hypothetical protein